METGHVRHCSDHSCGSYTTNKDNDNDSKVADHFLSGFGSNVFCSLVLEKDGMTRKKMGAK